MYKELACAIIEQAVLDWRAMIEKEKCHKASLLYNYNELRRFFNSDWCELLMVYMPIPPADILKHLEEERLNALERNNSKFK